MKTATRINEIKKRLTEELQPSQLEILDESHLHVGHEGAKSGKGHFSIFISAESLQGQSRVMQHRAIYAALSDLFETEIHALKITVS